MERIIIALILAVSLLGCGESASEYHDNGVRDASSKSLERDIDRLELRVKALEERLAQEPRNDR